MGMHATCMMEKSRSVSHAPPSRLEAQRFSLTALRSSGERDGRDEHRGVAFADLQVGGAASRQRSWEEQLI